MSVICALTTGNRNSPLIVLSGEEIAYIFFWNETNKTLCPYKSTDGGINWSALSTVSNTTIFVDDVSMQGFIGAALDSSGFIHVCLAGPSAGCTRDVAYCVFDTSDDSWGTWESAATYTKYGLSSNGAYIAVDSNDYPHIVYDDAVASMGSNYVQVRYINKTTGSWSAPFLVSPGGSIHCSIWNCNNIVVRGSDTVEVMYYDESTWTAQYRTRTGGSWGSITAVGTGYGNEPCGITATTGGTVYRYTKGSSYVTEGTNNVFSVSGHYTTNTGPTLMEDSIRFVNTDRYSPSPQTAMYTKNSGSGWSSFVQYSSITPINTSAFDQGLYWAYYNFFQYDFVWVLIADGTYYYLEKINMGHSQTVVPSPATVGLQSFDPSIPYWPVSVTVGFSGVDPTISVDVPDPKVRIGYAHLLKLVISDIIIEPTPASLGLSTVDPTVIYGSLVISGVASVGLGATDPAIYFGLVEITPDPASFALRTTDPVPVLGNLVITMSPADFALASQSPGVLLGSLEIALDVDPATLALLTVDPTVIEGSAYYGTLRYWNGSTWIKALVKVYTGTWASKPVKVYAEGSWQNIDVTG